MAHRSRARIVLTASAVLLTAAAVSFAVPGGAGSVESGLLVVSSAASREACEPCHAEIGQVVGDAVRFDHGPHIAVRCSVCHAPGVHAEGTTAIPEMETCFTCHGLDHGPVGLLASGECEDCHVPGFTLRPGTHTADWAARPHADASAGGVNGCLMCHDSGPDCDVCHTSEGLDVGPMPAIYLSTITPASAVPTVTVDPTAAVTISQCAYCHSDIDDFDVEGLVFTHNPHLERAYRCSACHETFPHSPDGTERPTMRSCYRCHSLSHGMQGEVAAGECEVCHTPDFELMPEDHTVAFRSGEHKDPAAEDPQLCRTCHGTEFCIACHNNGGGKLADGTAIKKVIPEDHTKPQWASEHGGLYIDGEGQCAACHTSASCQRCHQTTMPHPGTWLADHARGNGNLADDCNVCHRERGFCQDCHHDAVRSVDLVPENCVECHEEMKTEPPTDIKIAGLAEHAVHFSVADADKRGEPYQCDDCHVGFGSTGVHVTNPATGPHDMRICYECHGALDIYNVRIAPWPGSELCRRCHADLNL